MARYDPGLDRKKLNQLLKELSSAIRAFTDHRPIVRGRLETLRRDCGKSGCRCKRGELHETLVFVDRSEGKPKVRKINQRKYQLLKKPTDRYRRLKLLRARLSKIKNEIVECCDRLTAHRLRGGKRLKAKAFK